MYRQFSALFRSSAHTAAETIIDANAVTILRQHIRDSALNITKSRHAVATAMALHEQEISHHQRLVAQIKDLEARAEEAITAKKMDLAREAAEAIAHLENERDTSVAAQERFSTQIGELKSQLRAAQAKLRDLQRREKLAVATERTHKIHASAPTRTFSSLSDAEQTLDRLENRQNKKDLVHKAELQLQQEGNQSSVKERLAAAGCGKPVQSSADAVLARLQASAKKPAKQ